MLADLQWTKLQRLLALIQACPDSFYARRFREAGFTEPTTQFTSLEAFRTQAPFTKKGDILADRLASPPFGTNFTQPFERYTRFCQTSGTSTGQPMAVLDTPESWEAMLECWRRVYEAAQLRRGVDRIFFAFSFGPFLGFWTAFEAAARDYLIIPSGGQSTQARLETMARYQTTVLCCTPTYALRLGEHLGAPSGIERSELAIRKIIVAGEPGGSLPTVRARLRELWGEVQIFDHHGMTEVGPVSYEDPNRPGHLAIIEEAYLAEVLDSQGQEVPDGSEGELVLTTLDRTASPLIRYRTGDLVRKRRASGSDPTADARLYLEGGVLGRTDDMAVIRGVNIYPTAVESVVRQFPEVVEFMVEQRNIDAMEEIELLVEVAALNGDENLGEDDAAGAAAEILVQQRLEEKLRDTFSLRIPVRMAGAGELPRFEFKAKRWRRVG